MQSLPSPYQSLLWFEKNPKVDLYYSPNRSLHFLLLRLWAPYYCESINLSSKMLSDREEESSGSDSDPGFEEDMEALRRACSITGVDDSVNNFPKSSTPDDEDDTTYESEAEDMELLCGIQRRFSVPTTDVGTEQRPIFMEPLNIIPPSSLSEDNDDYGDDFETLRAIQRRFSQYNDSMNNSMESSLQRSEQIV